MGGGKGEDIIVTTEYDGAGRSSICGPINLTSEDSSWETLRTIRKRTTRNIAIDLEEAAAEFRMLYYGPDNNPEPPDGYGWSWLPDVMRLVDAVVYGEIYNRPGVDLRTRSLCTIAALVVIGHSPQMIKRHITRCAAHRRYRGGDLRNHRPDGVLRWHAGCGKCLPHRQGDLRRTGRPPGPWRQ